MEQFFEFVGNHWMLFLALAVIVALLVGGELQQHLSGVKDVEPTEATQLLNHQNAILLDIREEKEYEQGHITGALKVPLSRLEEQEGKLPAKKNKPVILFCRTGTRTRPAAAFLRKRGFETIYNLKGGLQAWRSANLPVHKGK